MIKTYTINRTDSSTLFRFASKMYEVKQEFINIFNGCNILTERSFD